MSQSTFKGVVKLSQTQYEKLKSEGTISVGDVTLTYDPTTTLYVTPSSGGSGGGGIDLNNSEFISSGNSDTWKVTNYNNGSIRIYGSDETEEKWMASVEVSDDSVTLNTGLLVYNEYTGTVGNTEISCRASDISLSSMFIPNYPTSGYPQGGSTLKINEEGLTFMYRYFTDSDTGTTDIFSFNHTSQSINGNQILTTSNGIAKQQGTENAGKVLTVGDDGNVTPQDASGGSGGNNPITSFTYLYRSNNISMDYDTDVGMVMTGDGLYAVGEVEHNISASLTLPIFEGDGISITTNTEHNKFIISTTDSLPTSIDISGGV